MNEPKTLKQYSEHIRLKYSKIIIERRSTTPFTPALSFQNNIVFQFLVFKLLESWSWPSICGIVMKQRICSTVVFPNLLIL